MGGAEREKVDALHFQRTISHSLTHNTIFSSLLAIELNQLKK
jgi:hypothetical protein